MDGETKSLASWQHDHEWSRRFLREMKRICGEHLIGEAPYEDDAERNTDLVVLRLEPFRIACRVRKFQYYDRFGGQFTIRSGRPSGHKTELAKIVEGWGHYILYGFCNEDQTALWAWVLGDLNVFRLWFNRQLVERRGVAPGLSQKNGDGSSSFMAFRICDLPAEFVIAHVLPEEFLFG